MTQAKSPLRDAVHDFRASWKTLAITDIAYKIIAFVLLTSVVGIAFRIMLSVSGRNVLADEDILYFLLEPVGWICMIVVGALWLAIFAFEQTALMGILCAKIQGRNMGYVGALQFALSYSGPVLYVTARLMTFMLAAVAPFLVVAGIIYLLLLTQYDINYYLTEQPDVFIFALALGAIIVIAITFVILRLATGWFFALPLVLFEGVKASRALSISRERAQGQRLLLLQWIVGWALVSLLLSAFITTLVIGLGHLIVPAATGSLPLLAVMIGLTLILWTITNLLVNLFSTTTFAVMLFNLYRHYGNQGGFNIMQLGYEKPQPAKPGFRLTRGRLLIAAVTGIALSIAVGLGVMSGVRMEDHAVVIAHRGASAAAPENTMAAVKQAISDQADWVEIDVQETADDQVVVFHDSDFMKISNVDLKIWDATMVDLANIDIGSRFDARFKAERVPTLRQVLAASKGKIGVIIELKYYGHDHQLEQRVAEIVEAENMQAEIMIMSLKSDKVLKMKALRPMWKVGLLTSAALGDLANAKADFLAINAGLASRNFVRSAQKSGKEVFVWTVNDAPAMSTMIGRGIDGLITDEPNLARTVLQHRASMSPLGRLLLKLAGIVGVTPDVGEQ